MFKKVFESIDVKNFGNITQIYKSDNMYLVIVLDRGETAFYFVDVKMQYLYPVNTLFQSIHYKHSFKKDISTILIDDDIDLTKYGHTVCPSIIRNMIQKNNL